MTGTEDRAAVEAAQRLQALVDQPDGVWMTFSMGEDLRAVLALLGFGVDREQWDAIAEAEGRRFEGEQIDDTLVGYLAYQRESSRALSHTLQREVQELEAERDAAKAALERLERERVGDAQAVAEACAGVVDGTSPQPVRHEYAVRRLRARFADRIAALAARDEAGSEL